MKEWGITDPMPFGKHRGVLIGTLIEDETSYISWLLGNTDFRLDEQALAYYEENR